MCNPDSNRRTRECTRQGIAARFLAGDLNVGIRKDTDMSENNNTRIGTISLWASILGIVVPIFIAFLVRIFVDENDEPYYMLCCLLFAGVELVALATGIIGRRSPSGKAGLSISAVCVVVTVLAVLILMPVRRVEHAPVEQTDRSQP